MIQHTSHLTQYAIVYGRKAQLFKRPKREGKKQYTQPVLMDIKWFKSKKDALEFKEKFDA